MERDHESQPLMALHHRPTVNHQQAAEHPIIRTRSRMKRKMDNDNDGDSISLITHHPVSKLAKQVWKGRVDRRGDDDDDDDDDDDSGDWYIAVVTEWRSGRPAESQMTSRPQNQNHDVGKASIIMPSKHTLELLLDTLQRRDTYEIFAQPVDPNEAEDYYEIIKEPMDFGTMRAKLHEGMYENLEQFEHDVFLIPENAMHFNSSATIYFRQARIVHELARKVFDALKMDPENFESKFSRTRRRSMRKALSAKPKESVSTSTRTIASKKKSAAGSRRSDGRLSEQAAAAAQVDMRPRQMYWASSLYNHQGDNKSLLMTNEGDIRYKDSLMSYVKDLGPTAQMVAKRKLLLLLLLLANTRAAEEDSSSFRTFHDFAQPACSNRSNILLNAKNASDEVIDLTKEEEEEEEDRGDRKRGDEKDKTTDIDGIAAGGGGKEKITHNRPINIAKRDVLVVTRNTTTNNSKNTHDDDNMRPVILALENSHSTINANASDRGFKSRNKKSPVADQLRQTLPFIFDLPFLKARLHQMKKGGGGEFV
ncbi:hypothetical protein OROHE_004413 [Orobanche hederae]